MCLLADSWADYTGPNQSSVQYLTVSDTHIWSITSYDNIFYCPTHFSVKTWTQLDGNARMIATNVSGDVIWCIDRKNYAYYRAGVSSSRLTGREWCPGSGCFSTYLFCSYDVATFIVECVAHIDNDVLTSSIAGAKNVINP